MKKQLTSILLTLALSAPVVADSGYGHDDDMTNKAMMSQGQMQKMQEHIQKMQNHMQEMHKEKDPKKLAELMENHMEMMRGGMGMIISGDKGMGKMNAASMNTHQRMGMMGNRMHMMQMMMKQMMDHMNMMAKQDNMSEGDSQQ